MINKYALSIIIFLLLLFSDSYSSSNNMSVSPYVYRGYSRSVVVSYAPTFAEIYEKRTNSSVVGRLSFDKDTIVSVNYYSYIPINTIGNIESFHNIGIKNKVEIGFYILPMPFGGTQRLRVKINLFDNTQKEKNNNLALSLFIGNNLDAWFADYFNIYSGISFGDKYKISNSLEIEYFTSPTFVWTHFSSTYRYLTYGEFKISGTMKELKIPISMRLILGERTIKQFLTFGLTPTFLLHYPKAHQDKSTMMLPSNGMYIDKSPISVSLEYGIYFGARRYNKERRKLKEISRKELIY